MFVNKKQKVVAIMILTLGFLSSSIGIGGIHDLSMLVIFAVPVALYLFFTKEPWIV